MIQTFETPDTFQIATQIATCDECANHRPSGSRRAVGSLDKQPQAARPIA